MRRVANIFDSPKAWNRFAIFAVVPALLCFCPRTASQSPPLSPVQSDSGKYLEHLVPFVPTPLDVAQKMLEVAKVQPDDVVYDLGSGDGRIVIMAAQKFHADAVGIEIDPDLCRQSLARIAKLGLERNARIIHGDLLAQNYSSADLVTVYLLPDSINGKVQPLLDRQLKKGARVVAHDFEFREWTPDKVQNIADDGEGRSHTLYLYRK